MSGVLNHLKEYESLYKIISGIDKNLFTVYNIPYCTHEHNRVFFIILSEEDSVIEIWNSAKSYCIDRGVLLEFDVMGQEEYGEWRRNMFPKHTMMKHGFINI